MYILDILYQYSSIMCNPHRTRKSSLYLYNYWHWLLVLGRVSAPWEHGHGYHCSNGIIQTTTIINRRLLHLSYLGFPTFKKHYPAVIKSCTGKKL